jgi:hypothetical protein
MYTQQMLHPSTIHGLFQNYDVRLSVGEIAASLKHAVAEVARFNIRPGRDGKIGRPEVAFLRHLHLGKRLW